MLSRCESIQGKTLEVTVVSGNRLKDTEWLSRQDPYVLVKYGGKAYRTATCTDGGRNPTFCDTFTFKLFEGLREVEISVYNSNTLSSDDFIGSGKVYLEEVLSRGHHDSSCTLINNQRSAGEIRLILKYPNAQSSEAQLPPPPTSPKPFYQIPPPQHLHYPAYQPQYPPQQPPAYGPYAPHPPDPIYPPLSPYNGRYAPQQPPPAYVPYAPHLPEPFYPPHSPYNDRYRRSDY